MLGCLFEALFDVFLEALVRIVLVPVVLVLALPVVLCTALRGPASYVENVKAQYGRVFQLSLTFLHL